MIRGQLTGAIFLLALGLVLGLVLGARIGGPGDLYDKDQPKTMAASVDVALSAPSQWGRWIWPRDMLGEPSTKPPMYNWLSAIVLKLSPTWREWTFKLPSILAALSIALMVTFAARSMLRAHDCADAIALLAGAVWLASAPVMKQMYLSRPDVVMCAFTTGAWLVALRQMRPPPGGVPVQREPGPAVAAGFWLCVAGAALTKGPAALIPVAYVPLAALWIHRRWSMPRMRWGMGIAILAATVGVWAILAYRQWPGAFFDILLTEGASRFTTGGPESIAKPFYLPAWWFLTHWAPWSVAAGLGVVMIGIDPRRWPDHPLAPAMLWVALVIIAFSIAPGKRADYLLPAYPAAAVLAAFGMIELLRRIHLPVALAALAPVVMGVYLAHYELRRSPEARTGHTRAVVRFAHEVDRTVASDAPIVSLVKGYHPLTSLLRRHAGNRARPEDLVAGTWVIAPRNDAWPAHVLSRELRDVVQTGPKTLEPGRVGLYRIGDEGVTPAALLPILTGQEAWNFPPDRYRATR